MLRLEGWEQRTKKSHFLPEVEIRGLARENLRRFQEESSVSEWPVELTLSCAFQETSLRADGALEEMREKVRAIVQEKEVVKLTKNLKRGEEKWESLEKGELIKTVVAKTRRQHSLMPLRKSGGFGCFER